MNTLARILIIEDEEPISELVRLNLSMAGYKTCQAMDGAEGMNCIKTEEFDLVILDLMLPGIDGYELLPEIVKKGIPVILLTAKDSLKDKVKGLDMGADDYIVKPFEGMELLARVKSVLRRCSAAESSMKGFDDISILPDQRKVLKSGREVSLTHKEFELLRVLVDNTGKALSREQLLRMVWDYDYEGSTRTVDMHIQRLRDKLGTGRIKTVYKLGYRLDG